VSYLTTYSEAAKERPGCQNIVEIVANGSEKDRILYIDLVRLVDRIRASQTDGMEELYQLFSTGLRFFLWRQTGPQDLEDRLHDVFILIVQAIRRGEIREPERLMGFVRTVARRQVSAHIKGAVHARVIEIPVEFERGFVHAGDTPEQAAIFRERENLIKKVLSELSDRDREILTRFYIREQSESKICLEMVLTETQFRLLKSRAKARFGELGKKKLARRTLGSLPLRLAAGHA
jgi:RNA polymerase sigma-70 factor (ECF subfamily)